MIRVENIEKTVAELKLENSKAAILAASRAIASALRPQDGASRLSSNHFGVITEGVAAGEINELATKIVAQGLSAAQWGLKGGQIQFQIAVARIDKDAEPVKDLLTQLEEALRVMAEQGTSSRIYTLPRARNVPEHVWPVEEGFSVAIA